MKNATVTFAVLAALEAAGDEGLRFGELQQAAYAASHPGQKLPRDKRGWWCTQLLGGPFYHGGLLHVFAAKGADGRWRRSGVAAPARPWTLVRATRHPSRHRPF